MSEEIIITKEDLEEARKFFAGDKFATVADGAIIDEVKYKYAKCSLEIKDIHRNALGAVMGGAMYTLADFCFAVASNFKQGPTVTVVSQISYLGQPKGMKLIAKSRLIKDGRKNCFYEINVEDELGTPVAVMSCTGAHL